MSRPNWQPSASIQNMELRAKVLAKIRQFFAARNVLEVETPLLCQSTIPSPNIHSFQVALPSSCCIRRNDELRLHDNEFGYLQTSPEFAMKRIIAATRRDVFQICKAFRDEECGRLHNREFTMLEWYRVGFDHHKLMDEMDELLQEILGVAAAERVTYSDIFERVLNLNPFESSIAAMKACALERGLNLAQEANLYDRTIWLQLLFSHFIEPNLGPTFPTFVYNFPAKEAALAKISATDSRVAERFEVYYKGIELANGFHELTDAAEQRQRFEAELQERAAQALPLISLDENFFAAINSLPSCAGVAIGVDRLLLLLSGAKSLSAVISFVGNE